ETERGENAGENRLVRNILLFREIREIDAAREFRSPVLVLPEKREPRRLQPVLRETHGLLQREALRLADARHVAPHIFTLGRVDVERAVVPALRTEDRPEQEGPPEKADARRLRRRLDAHRRRKGI